MRTTLNLDDTLIHEAEAALPDLSRTAVINEALRVLVAQKAQQRLAEETGGGAPHARMPPRRRFQ